MAKCSFCGKDIPRGTGKIYVKKDGKKFDFCSLKCQKHLLFMKHVGRTTRWTETFTRNVKDVKAGEEKKENEDVQHD